MVRSVHLNYSSQNKKAITNLVVNDYKILDRGLGYLRVKCPSKMLGTFEDV